MQQEKGTVICILDLQDTHVSQTNKKLSQALQTKYTTCKQPYTTKLDYIQILGNTNIKIFHVLNSETSLRKAAMNFVEEIETI